MFVVIVFASEKQTRAHLGFDSSNVFNRYSIIYLRIYLKINCKE